MKKTSLEERFLKAAAAAFDVKPARIGLKTKKSDLMQWDSLGHLKLFLSLEKEFRVNFPAKQIMRYDNLNDIYRDLAARVKN